MSSYTLEEIIKRWGKEELTAEQAIGQILLLLQDVSGRVGQLEQRMEAWRQSRRMPPANEK